jgi:D-3-phosphoglycerate dehydrogenase
LLKKTIAGAACDAFVVEPPPPDHPLLTLNNFVATPHIGGVTAESVPRMTIQAAEEIMRVLQGQRPLYPINPQVLNTKH